MERELGRVIAEQRAEAQRQIELLAARADAAVAGLQARATELDARIAGMDRLVSERVEAGIAAGLAEIAERSRPDDAPMLALAERVAELEARGSLVVRLEESLARFEGQMTAAEARGAEFAAWQEALVIPAVPDLSGLATREELAEVRAAIPEPADLSGFATREDVEAVRVTIIEPRDWTADIARAAEVAERAVADMTARFDTKQAEAKSAADARDEEVRAEVKARLASHHGTLPVIRGWTDGVHYAGTIVSHDGTTWQARRDTGKAPPHEDWSCIVARGEPGEDGRTFVARGTFAAEETYAHGDVVAFDGSSFVAVRDGPGACPGDGWQLIASRGGRGKPGDSVKGDKGRPGDPVVAATISDDGLLTLTNGDGSTVECDLYPVLAKVR